MRYKRLEANIKRGSELGAAFFEFAILLPLFLIIFTAYWDVVVVAITKERHNAALIQLAARNRFRPLYIFIDQGPTPDSAFINVRKANFDELDIFMPGMLQFYHNIIDNIGSGSSLVTAGMAAELWYYDICVRTRPGGRCQNAQNIGSASDSAIAGDGAEYNPPDPARYRFYTEPEDDECFAPNGDQSIKARIQTDFNTYKRAQNNLILRRQLLTDNTNPTSPPVPFGRLLMQLNMPVVPGFNIPDITAYSRLRPVMYLAQCSIPPRFYGGDPIVDFRTFFFDVEAQFE